MSNHREELDRRFAWFEGKLPPRPAKAVLGIWMLPLGLVLFAQDVPALQKPTARMLGWVQRKWVERQRAKSRP